MLIIYNISFSSLVKTKNIFLNSILNTARFAFFLIDWLILLSLPIETWAVVFSFWSWLDPADLHRTSYNFYKLVNLADIV